MSVQSVIAGLFMKAFVKGGTKPMTLDYMKVRKLTDKFVKKSGTPADISHTPVAANWAAGLCPAEWLSVANPQRTVLYFHGGGYFFCGLDTHRAACGYLARKAQARVLSVDYRMAPEHPCPAAVDDAVAWWRALLDQGISPSNVVFAGDSAGGGLAVACMLSARDQGLPMPAGAVLFSPWVDLSCSGETMRTMAKADRMFNPYLLPQAATYYLQGRSAQDPLASPLFGDLTGLPPLQIFASEHEILLSDSMRLHEKAQAAGVPCSLLTRPQMPHVWPIMLPLPEAREDMAKAGQFIAKITAA